jgi:hypothetical protein
MKWLQANPLGMALAGTSGFLILLALIIAVFWSLPVSVNIDETDSGSIVSAEPVAAAAKVGPFAEYDVINQKPVFNESRMPVIEAVEDDLLGDEEIDESGIAVADAPDVRLTGIIITPGMKIASLTPNDSSIESVMAYEGDALTGEFVGWHISTVNSRDVVLASSDGQTLELELEVHDSKIQQPPSAVAPAKQAEAGKSPAKTAAAAAEGDEPLSRAEQIRQRIAERREELRREQEQAQKANNQRGSSNAARSNNARASRDARANQPSAYQEAMQAKIREQSKDKSSDDNEDG